MLVKFKRVIVVASNQELTNEHYCQRLWLAARNMPISRRQWLNVLAHTIYNFDGVILSTNGMLWSIPEIDEVMGDDRWLSLYFEEDDGRPRREVRLKERLRMLDLYFRIAKPHMQRRFAK
ncbi:MAG: hypothetical protein L3J26_06790 [Candidatus Polarisedimenticolaceae bacterium]|nr:hypothetical protein [Candidatus Polarisedimenticolaceae bacterium]